MPRNIRPPHRGKHSRAQTRAARHTSITRRLRLIGSLDLRYRVPRDLVINLSGHRRFEKEISSERYERLQAEEEAATLKRPRRSSRRRRWRYSGRPYLSNIASADAQIAFRRGTITAQEYRVSVRPRLAWTRLDWDLPEDKHERVALQRFLSESRQSGPVVLVKSTDVINAEPVLRRVLGARSSFEPGRLARAIPDQRFDRDNAWEEPPARSAWKRHAWEEAADWRDLASEGRASVGSGAARAHRSGR
jgi:hypothetical protein